MDSLAPFPSYVLQGEGDAGEYRINLAPRDTPYVVHVGRAPDNGLTLRNRSVSGRHAHIEVGGRHDYTVVVRDHGTDGTGSRFGTLSKRLFKSALCIAFQHYPFSEKELDDICEHYDCGLPDAFNGGLLDVAWRDFVNDILSAEVITKEVAYTETDMDATDAGYSDKIATGIDKVAGGFEETS